jgi:hypothetical protein
MTGFLPFNTSASVRFPGLWVAKAEPMLYLWFKATRSTGFAPYRFHSTTALPAMPATFSAALAELTELRSARAILQADGRDYGASVLTDAIEKLEAQLGVNQVRA